MADNNNVMADNNNDDNLKLSKMEEIFVPKDLDRDGSRKNYIEYSTMLFKPVPKNCVLVKKNRFTGKISVAGAKPIRLWIPFIKKEILIPRKTTGLKMTSPILSKGMLISTVDRTIDFDKIEYLTKDGIMVNVDIAAIVNITDAKKYMEKGKEQFVQLDILIKKLLRMYIAERDFEFLSKGECRLNDFDHTGELSNFENKYGIKINKIIFKEVRLPERLQKLYNDRAEETQKKKAQIVQLEAAKEKAKIDAEIQEIKAEAEAKKIQIIESAKAKAWTEQMKIFIKYLEDKGMKTERITELLAEQLKLKTVTDSNANAIFSFGDHNSNTAANIAAGINAAHKNNRDYSNQTNIPQRNITKSEQLIKDAKWLVYCQAITEEEYEKIMKLVTDPVQKKLIDGISDKEYERFIEGISQKNTMGQQQSFGPTHKK